MLAPIDMPPITSFADETVHIRCGGADSLNSPVDWFYQPSLDEKGYQIISAGYLVNGNFDGRLSISGSTLIIVNLTVDISGIFTCRENVSAGPQHQVQLIVRVNGKMCRSTDVW